MAYTCSISIDGVRYTYTGRAGDTIWIDRLAGISKTPR